MAVDVWKYREIILNGISCKNHVVIPVEDIEKYKHFTKFINSHIIKNNIFIPFSFMVGYNIETIDDIITIFKERLKELFLTNKMNNLAKKVDMSNFHIHSYTIEQILTSSDEDYFYICDHC